jgi:hypothetical protein
MMERLTLSRIILGIGLLVGLGSFWQTVSHIGNPLYLLPFNSPEGSEHGWYHFFREICADVAMMTVFILVFVGSDEFRTRQTWWLTFILMVGYYAPFWIGGLFLVALSAPSTTANVVHIAMATFAFAALFIGRPAFLKSTAPIQVDKQLV